MHDVPTHLEVTDKLVFGLTAGQTLFTAGSVFVGYSLGKRLIVAGMPLPWALPMATLTALLLTSLALVRPEDRSLDQWCFILLRYQFQPRICLLSRQHEAGTRPAGDVPIDPFPESSITSDTPAERQLELWALFDPKARFRVRILPKAKD